MAESLAEPAAEPLLTVEDLHTYLATGQGVVRAVDGVSFTVGQAEVLGIVGESGCGKTVTCRTIMGLMPRRTAFSSGQVIYHPNGGGSLLDLPQRELQKLRGAHLAMIFQDPMTALNPVRSIGDQLIEAVTAHASLSRDEARDRAIGLLIRVGIPAPERRMRDYPFQFSGGMLQRALIAIALASSSCTQVRSLRRARPPRSSRRRRILTRKRCSRRCRRPTSTARSAAFPGRRRA